MNRRSFIKGSAATLATASFVPTAWAGQGQHAQVSPQTPVRPALHFNKNGKFRIVQFTDTHYISGNDKAERALKNVTDIVETEHPDLVIHTGDLIFGKPAKESFQEILKPIADHRIPFAVTLGNHDEEFGLSRSEVMEFIRTIPGNINTPQKPIYGVSNEVLTLTDAQGKVQWAFYLMDSGNQCKDINRGGYDYLHFDQLAWYRQNSMELSQENGGVPVPSLAFMHIPLREYIDGLADTKRMLRGNLGENPCAQEVNSGMFALSSELKDIKAYFSGHDHDNDYMMKYHDTFLAYGRYSGGDTVYNDLLPNGCRVIELTEGKPEIETWIHLSDGSEEQHLTLPDSFNKC